MDFPKFEPSSALVDHVSRGRLLGRFFMEYDSDKLIVGQFALDRNHVITAWDEGLERLTGCRASDMIGTSDQWRAFSDSPQSVLSDFFLEEDFEGACSRYGDHGIWLLEQSREWLALSQCLGANDQVQAVITRATGRAGDGGVVQTIYLIERIASWVQVSSDRYDGMKILAENVPAGVCLIQDDRMIFVNKTFCTMFGYDDASELLHRRSADMLVEEQRSAHVELIQSLTRNNAGGRYQWTGLDKNGRKVWFEGRPLPIEWNGRPAVISFVMDISEFKEREEIMAMESQALRQENARLLTTIDTRTRLGNIIGRSRKMQEVYDAVIRASASEAGVIVYGETGTGKELVAKAIHTMGRRSYGEFVPVNCGAVPEELFESEFFGHRKGSFTGADSDKPGLLDRAGGGTLFLDEVGELRPSSQAKLLRVLGSGEYTAVGGREPKQADIRVIAATNRSLEEMVRQGTFRQDLFYRIQILPIFLPPLRERKEDIPFLVADILTKLGSPGRMVSRDLTLLMEHDWPGNVRELRNVLERYVAFGNLDFFQAGDGPRVEQDGPVSLPEGVKLRDALAFYEKELILRTLEKHGGNRSRTAAALGLPRKTLFRKMKALGIE